MNLVKSLFVAAALFTVGATGSIAVQAVAQTPAAQGAAARGSGLRTDVSATADSRVAPPAAAAPLASEAAPIPAPNVEPTPAPPLPDGTAAPGPDATAAPAPAAPASLPVIAPSTDGFGMPTGGMGLQKQVTDVGKDAAYFHDIWLIPIITVVTLLVLALLAWVILRYRRSANPVPSRTSHNTLIEVIWTVAPVAILVAIAFPSLGLLARQYAPPKADITVKVIGNQWYWTYQYPDHGDFEFVSNMLKEPTDPSVTKGQRTRTAQDGPRLLAVDDRMVVPVNSVVKVIVTSADVMHAFAMPAFWQKMDAVPGRLNETWFKADKEGVYFGQCSELCGARHGFMPIAIEVVSPARFAAWVASKGGKMPGAGAPAGTDSTAASPITNAGTAGTGDRVTATEGDETSTAPTQVIDVVDKPAVSTQGTANSARGGMN